MSKIMSGIHYLLFILLLIGFCDTGNGKNDPICIVGSGIGGSSAAHFIRKYSCASNTDCEIETIMFDERPVVGGRMAMVNLSGDLFEAGASIIHPKNLHALHYTQILGLKQKTSGDDDDDDDFGIWDGEKFVFKTLNLPLPDLIQSYLNKLLIFLRYGTDLFKMQRLVDKLLNKFLHYYDNLETRPVFQSVDEMLKWAGLYDYTQQTLEKQLVTEGISSRLITELITVITRINYGQDVRISGLAGTVSLCGSGGGLWAVKGGNWQMAAGLIKHANVSLHLEEAVMSVSSTDTKYELKTSTGQTYKCEAVIIATPLDEVNISFLPPISVSIPERHLQHTYTTFVRGLLNPEYFGLKSSSSLPELIGTLEQPSLPFSSISVLKEYSEVDKAYKIFSRKELTDDLLDKLFRIKTEIIRINWAAYPHYKAPEHFSPFLLDGHNLYYINAFENAASTMETSAVAAENVARLILSRFPFNQGSILKSGVSESCTVKMEL